MNKALREKIEKRAAECEAGPYRQPITRFILGAEAAAEILEAENAKLVAVLDGIIKHRNVNCWTCDGGEWAIDMATEALDEYKKGRGE